MQLRITPSEGGYKEKMRENLIVMKKAISSLLKPDEDCG
jgi:hypothetical protein